MNDLLTAYGGRIKRLRNCCARIDAELGCRHLSVTDCDLLYESSFLNATAFFESLLEDVFTEMVCGRPSQEQRHFSLVRPVSKEAFRNIFRKNGEYAVVLPYPKMVEMAKVFLNDGLPFTLIDQPDRDLLSQSVKIRNAIAHKSRRAVSDFKRDVPGVNMLPSNRQVPGVFLRTIFRRDPIQKRIDLYFANYLRVLSEVVGRW